MPISYTSPVTVPNDPNRKINQLYAAGDALSQMLGAFAQRRERRAVDAERDAAMVIEAVQKGQLPPDSASVADAIDRLEKRDPGRARVYRDMIEWIKANPEQPDAMETFFDLMDQPPALPIDAMAAPPGAGGMGGPGVGGPSGPLDIGGGAGGGMTPLGPGMPGGMADFMGPQGAPFTPQAGGPSPDPGPQVPADVNDLFGDMHSAMVGAFMQMPPGQALSVIGQLEKSQRDILYSGLEETFDPLGSGVSGEQLAMCAASPECREKTGMDPKAVAYFMGKMGFIEQGTPGQQAEHKRAETKVELEGKRAELTESGQGIQRERLGLAERKEQRLREGRGPEGGKPFKEKTLPSAVAKEIRELMDRNLEVYVPTRDVWTAAEKKPSASSVLDRAADIYNRARQQGMDDQAAAALVMEQLRQQIRRKSIRDE